MKLGVEVGLGPGHIVISERELTVVRPSVCLSVCKSSAPYSGGCNFRQYFYGIWYIGHPLTFTDNFTEIIRYEPLRRGS